MTRVIVCGSRDWTDREIIHRELGQISDRAVLVHGACETGADKIAAEEWEGAGLKVEPHPASWLIHAPGWCRCGKVKPRVCKGAGPKRNQEMADLGADLCLAFPLKDSRGTWDMVRRAKKKGIEVKVVQPSKEK